MSDLAVAGGTWAGVFGSLLVVGHPLGAPASAYVAPVLAYGLVALCTGARREGSFGRGMLYGAAPLTALALYAAITRPVRLPTKQV